MGQAPTAEQRTEARAAAERDAAGTGAYAEMCRGTLAALDWIEGRTEVAPMTGRRCHPRDLLDGRPIDARAVESGQAAAVGERPGPEQHYAGAVWAALSWAVDADHPGGLAINVQAADA